MIKIRVLLYFLTVTLFLQSGCKDQKQPFSFKGTTILIDTINAPQEDSLVQSIIVEYSESLKSDMSRVLVHSAHVMERGTPQGRLNNFVADLVLETGRELYNPEDDKPIDFCLLNYGGLRVPLPEGEITYERVYELLPFENEMVVVTLSGEKTRELFHYLAEASVGMPVSGVKLTIENNKPVSIEINNQEFDVSKNYKVLTSDYLAGGGDNMNFFLQPINYELLGMRVRDAIINFMQREHARGNKIRSELDERITIKK